MTTLPEFIVEGTAGRRVTVQFDAPEGAGFYRFTLTPKDDYRVPHVGLGGASVTHYFQKEDGPRRDRYRHVPARDVPVVADIIVAILEKGLIAPALAEHDRRVADNALRLRQEKAQHVRQAFKGCSRALHLASLDISDDDLAELADAITNGL